MKVSTGFRVGTENGKNGLKQQVHDWLTTIRLSGAPIWFYKVWGSRYARAGVPDYLLCVAGRLIAIELKSPGAEAEPSAIQGYELRQLKQAGALTLVTNSLEEAQAIVREALARLGWQELR